MSASTERREPPQELLSRHVAFWRREDVDRRLLVEGGHQPCWADVARMYAGYDGIDITPAEADVQRYLAAIDWGAAWQPGEQDLFMVLPPNTRIPWMEAVAGCRVIPQLASNSLWSKEPDGLPPNPRRIAPNEAWLAALLAQVDALAKVGPPVTQALMRGPGDAIEALIGGTALVYAMMDEAEWLRPLVDSATDAFIRTARAQWERIRPSWGGFVNFFGFWSPEPCVRCQEDVQRILTPALYRRWLRPALERIVSAFPRSMFHMHSGSLNMVEEVASVPGLGALQVSIDEPPYAPPITALLDALRQAQERVPLFVEGPMTREQFAVLQRELSPRGLALRAELTD